jgi:four helix bundle protein
MDKLDLFNYVEEKMDAEALKKRTKQFALRPIKLVEALPATRTANVIGNELLRSGTSVGANYRAACRGRTKPDFASKIGIVIEEADESLFWMELLTEAGIVPEDCLSALLQEADELVAIFTASAVTAKKNITKKKRVMAQ